jgi:hypothetical protein
MLFTEKIPFSALYQTRIYIVWAERTIIER